MWRINPDDPRFGRLASIALSFAAPAWLLWGRRGSLAFVGFTLVTAMVPDADLFLRRVLPTVQHHGVTHTVIFVLCASVGGGVVVSRTLTGTLNDHAWIHSDSISRETVFVFSASGFLLGGLAHVFGDLLSAPDIASPIEPLWPFYRQAIIVDVIYYDSPIWNFGLLAVAIALHVALDRWETYPIDSPCRTGGDTSPPSISSEDADGKR